MVWLMSRPSIFNRIRVRPNFSRLLTGTASTTFESLSVCSRKSLAVCPSRASAAHRGFVISGVSNPTSRAETLCPAQLTLIVSPSTTRGITQPEVEITAKGRTGVCSGKLQAPSKTAMLAAKPVPLRRNHGAAAITCQPQRQHFPEVPRQSSADRTRPRSGAQARRICSGTTGGRHSRYCRKCARSRPS